MKTNEAILLLTVIALLALIVWGGKKYLELRDANTILRVRITEIAIEKGDLARRHRNLCDYLQVRGATDAEIAKIEESGNGL